MTENTFLSNFPAVNCTHVLPLFSYIYATYCRTDSEGYQRVIFFSFNKIKKQKVQKEENSLK